MPLKYFLSKGLRNKRLKQTHYWNIDLPFHSQLTINSLILTINLLQKTGNLKRKTFVYKYTSVPYLSMCLVAQSCLTLCSPTKCSLPGSSVHGIFPVRILEQVAMPSSRGSSQSKDQPTSLALAGGFFSCSTTWKVLLSIEK